MRTIGKVLVGAAVLSTASPAVMAEDVNVECACRVSPINTVPWFDYVITTSVSSKDKATSQVLAYACYQKRSQASNACMEGKDRDSSLQHFKGKLQSP